MLIQIMLECQLVVGYHMGTPLVLVKKWIGAPNHKLTLKHFVDLCLEIIVSLQFLGVYRITLEAAD